LGRRAERHPPSLFNRVLSDIQSWDGRAPTLEAQVVLPISNPVEMDLALDEALERLAGDAAYRDLFERTYADGVTAATLAQSLGAFVGRLTFGDTAVDRFQAARARSALSREERAGLWIYESKGRCWQCHSGPNFTDSRGSPRPDNSVATPPADD
jgi:cytochrome c peroxidase